MQNGKHIDFTGVEINDADSGLIEITRVDPADHRCESCEEPAEYQLRAVEWDVHGQCTVNECQQCLIEENGSIFSLDSYSAKS